MRTLVYSLLKEGYNSYAPLLNQDGQTLRIYGASALGSGVGDLAIPAVPQLPFLSIRQMPSQRFREVRELSTANRQTYQIYFYDVRGGYTRIDEMARMAQSFLEGNVGTVSPSGARCLGCEWLSVSQDFTDEQYDAIVRFGTAQLTSTR